MTSPAIQLAREFHDLYESLAPSFGYETRPDTKVFDPNSRNGRLMTAVCERLVAKAQALVLRGAADEFDNYREADGRSIQFANALRRMAEELERKA